MKPCFAPMGLLKDPIHTHLPHGDTRHTLPPGLLGGMRQQLLFYCSLSTLQGPLQAIWRMSIGILQCVCIIYHHYIYTYWQIYNIFMTYASAAAIHQRGYRVKATSQQNLQWKQRATIKTIEGLTGVLHQYNAKKGVFRKRKNDTGLVNIHDQMLDQIIIQDRRKWKYW